MKRLLCSFEILGGYRSQALQYGNAGQLNFGGNQEIINIPTLKRIVERNGWFNRHRDTRELNVNYQRIKPPINKTIGKPFKRENANVLR